MEQDLIGVKNDKPPIDFDVKDFLEGIREHWLFEIRDGGGLDIDVYLEEGNLEMLDERMCCK